MLELGSIVTAAVVRLEPYGAYLDYAGNEILVLIVDLSWERVRNPSDVATIGGTVSVKIVRFNEDRNLYIGSIKAVDQTTNPYRALHGLPTDAVIRGTVENIYPGSGAMIRLIGDGIWGSLRMSGGGQPLKVGQEIDVVIRSLDVENGALELGPAAPLNKDDIDGRTGPRLDNA